MDGTVPSLNLSYIFAHLYQLATGVHIDLTAVPEWSLFLVEVLAVFGVVTSVLLLVMTIYTHMQTLHVEHSNFHRLEERERAKHMQAVYAPKNPRWEALSALASSPDEGDWRRAILEADSMLAALLVERGYMGESVGEQLKLANPLQFTTLDLAWEAHRMRNAIAHMGEAFPLSERDVRATIDQYRRVFEEFDYI